MAGIQGQPTASPKDIVSPVPGAAQQDAFEAGPQPTVSTPAADQGSADAFAAGPTGQAAPAPVAQGYSGPGASLLGMSADAAPTIGAIGGGIAGAVGTASPPGAIAMGMAGAAVGSAYKQFINQAVLKRQPVQSLSQDVDEMKQEAGNAGVGELAGLGVSAGAAKLAATRMGTAALDGLTSITAGPLNAIKANASAAISKLAEPFEKILASKVTPMTSEEIGDSVKQNFVNSLTEKYGEFAKSYGQIKQVANQTPVDNEALTKFTTGLKSYAETLGGDQKRYVMKLADDLDGVSVNSGIDSITKQLRSEANEAYRVDGYDRGNFLKDLMSRTDGFFEDRVHNLATRVIKGTAKPGELSAFNDLVSQAGQEGNLGLSLTESTGQFARTRQAVDSGQDMRQVASDYLKNKDTVKANYAKFRGLLDEVGEQTKVSPMGRGPMQFLQDIQEVPSEQLADRMFQPKNAATLRLLKDEHPEVFQSVMQNKMSNIVAKHTNIGGDINYGGIAKEVEALPGSTSSLLLTAPERKTMLEVANNPRLDLIRSEHQSVANKIALGMARIGEITRSGIESGIAPKVLPTVGAAVGATMPVQKQP